MLKIWRFALSGKLFVVGFSLGLVLFIGANIYSYSQAIPPCCDLATGFGVPFQMGTFGGYFDHTSFVLIGLITDTLSGLGASLFFGWVFAESLPTILRGIQHAVQWHFRTRS